MSLPVIVICVEDLKKIVPHFTKEYLDNKEYKGDMAALLRNLGVDTNYALEYQELEAMSRTKLCGIVKTDRIVGVERTDRAWLTSGNASDTAKLFTEDASLAKEIRKMKRGIKETNTTENKEND